MENRIDVLVVCANGDYTHNFEKTQEILTNCVGNHNYRLTSVNPDRIAGSLVYDEHIQASFGKEEMRRKIEKKYDIILFQNCMTGNPHVGSMSVFFYEDAIQQIVDFLKDDGIFINFSGSYYDGKKHEEKEEGSVEPKLERFFDPKNQVTVENDNSPVTYDVWRKKRVQTFGMGEKQILKKIDEFCSVIKTEKDAREKFVSLPLKIREIFSEYAQKIVDSSLKGSVKNAKKVLEIYKKVKKIEYEDYTDVSIIVRGPDTKQEKDKLKSMFGAWNQGLNAWVFSKKRREEVIKFIANTNVAKEAPENIPKPVTKPARKSTEAKSSAVSGKYDENIYQKKDTPEEDDPLYIFYTTLAQEKPDSILAIQWMVEHGVNYEENVEAYEKLKKEKKLIKLS
jgi:hypothetical protein